MDASASTKNSKRQKTSEGQSNEDRISNLPENIIHYILSLLPTKYAVATSVLSTRWRHLWTSIHNLDFYDRLLYSTEETTKVYSKRRRAFTKFIDRVFQLNNVSNIHKFSLICWDCNEARFNKWISKVIGRNVQELILSFGNKLSYLLPRCLLTYESWKILKIDMLVSTNIPSSICFSSLKVLHLKRITFSGDQSTQEISLSCPVLEELVMDECKWLEIKTLTIAAPTLQGLTLHERWYRDYELLGCEIKVYAHSILSLKLKCLLYYKYSLHNLSSLVNARVVVRITDNTLHCVGTLLRDISNVKDLELSADLIAILFHPDISAHLFPFLHLTHLSVVRITETSPLRGRQLVDLLLSIPNIQSLRFPDGLDSFIFKGQGRMLGTTPQCFLSHLKLVDLGIFSWKDNELWFVRFLMKSARVVDKLTIKVRRYKCVSGWTFEDWNERINKQFDMLSALARDSNCVLDFASQDCKASWL